MDKRELTIIDSKAVAAHLDYPGCMAAIRDAMIALSNGRTRQLLRTMIPMRQGRTFAQMPGALGDDAMFGAKMISVFADPDNPGTRRHRGIIAMFEPEHGMPVAIVDAEEVTHIRTAAATAVATDALARVDARRLLILGTGGQAHSHLAALRGVRPFERIAIWGRDADKASAIARRYADELPIEAIDDLPEGAARADVICTLTGAREPILRGEWLRPGCHVNIVGSSGPGPVEVDTPLVVRSRFIADSRTSALDAAAEFLVAKAAGAVSDAHIVAEIGEVLSGTAPGRQSDEDITAYKSLGHAVQDLAAAAYLIERIAH
ncbi:ornithine cyclodeaminase family protein [Croceicoccus hydrothermalis]|uniref:ornithine cyclodeaminase family protein n=1 Tax=Croceicoccus hydrothermalis TaxID=2867964 RepID=UPI001EFC0B5A|nr:ornithine cyclodeaminase family protein [Croceicoccus hydrothermalis]